MVNCQPSTNYVQCKFDFCLTFKEVHKKSKPIVETMAWLWTSRSHEKIFLNRNILQLKYCRIAYTNVFVKFEFLDTAYIKSPPF
jgi:hypothetical protein